jgi:hypothetical protein
MSVRSIRLMLKLNRRRIRMILIEFFRRGRIILTSTPNTTLPGYLINSHLNRFTKLEVRVGEVNISKHPIPTQLNFGSAPCPSEEVVLSCRSKR